MSALPQGVTTGGTLDVAGLAQATKAALAALYRRDDRPWVVAFSGGKDSTLLLQLVYEFLLELGRDARKSVHVVASDTGVEAPNVSEYLGNTLARIDKAAGDAALPLHVHLVHPEPHESFWAKLIGSGYPSPSFGQGAKCSKLMDDVMNWLNRAKIGANLDEEFEACLERIVEFGSSHAPRSKHQWFDLIRLVDGKLLVRWIRDHYQIKDECRFRWARDLWTQNKLRDVLDDAVWNLACGQTVS